MPATEGDGHPPCPSAGAPPPGHDKGAEPQDRPCKGGKSDQGNGKDDKSKDNGDEHKSDGGEAAGGLLLMPLGVAGSATIWVPQRKRSRRPGWLHERRRAR